MNEIENSKITAGGVIMWIYHPIEELSRKDPAKHNWYNTAEDESDCKKKIKELVKSGKYKKRELTYRYFQW